MQPHTGTTPNRRSGPEAGLPQPLAAHRMTQPLKATLQLTTEAGRYQPAALFEQRLSPSDGSSRPAPLISCLRHRNFSGKGGSSFDLQSLKAHRTLAIRVLPRAGFGCVIDDRTVGGWLA